MATQFTARVGNQARFQQVPKLVGEAVNIEQGKFYVEVAGYLVVPAAANAATGKRPCVALTSADNTLGLNGAMTVLVEYGAMYDLVNSGASPVSQANVGAIGYLANATTISTNSADGPPAGEIVAFQPLDPPYPFGRPVRVAVE